MWNPLKLSERFRKHKSKLNHRHPDIDSAISLEVMNSTTRPGVMSWSVDQRAINNVSDADWWEVNTYWCSIAPSLHQR